jgi:hypothetical protein
MISASQRQKKHPTSNVVLAPSPRQPATRTSLHSLPVQFTWNQSCTTSTSTTTLNTAHQHWRQQETDNNNNMATTVMAVFVTKQQLTVNIIM